MYDLVYSVWKNSPRLDIDGFFYLISESWLLNRVFTLKNIHRTVGGVPVHVSVRLETVDDDQKNLEFFWSSPWQPQVFKLVPFTGFLGFGGVWGLYVRTRDLPRAMRRKLVVIGASRVLLDPIFVYRVLRAITQKHVRARSSHTIWSTQTVFSDR